MHFLFFLFSIFCREKVAMENLYLTSPFVNGKGDSAVADFFGDFVIRSHGSKSQFIQLGYISPGSRGALQYKNKIEDDKFEIEVTVSVNDNNTIKSGQGLIIFISNSDQHEEGDFYGKGGSIDVFVFVWILLIIKIRLLALILGISTPMTLRKFLKIKNMLILKTTIKLNSGLFRTIEL
ncbi:hypothetical protein NBO_55gi001 [Nosema bombycis CQ1]|uniref:Uncharacterized protein n=1 Tax=Nosema bombycis (strain CQ1 / CVCC 102059) TaxID=578461 RepID=R0KSV6_NOSB1|nr:hypothetical protein NBO_55gi001 [Nosema bombycis CQ1]|eukprot:EOB13846.1 hypothetical protein NBO_55gi001 [Nosema bombycis CQ1]